MHALAPLALCLLLAPSARFTRQDPPPSAAAESSAAATPLADPRLALPVADPAPEAALGMALWEARAGRTASALERVAGLRAGAQGDFAARLDREAARLQAWSSLRDAYLASLVASGEKLVLPDGDKKVRVGIERIEGGVLHLAPNKPGWATLSVEQLPVGELAQQMDRAAEGLAPAWVRLYGYALAGNERWSKLLKDDGPEARSARRQPRAGRRPGGRGPARAHRRPARGRGGARLRHGAQAAAARARRLGAPRALRRPGARGRPQG
jgi:hypothetical protein